MTLNDAIKELQKTKRARAKELKAKYPDMDAKEISKRAGRICLIRGTNRGCIEEIGFTAKLDKYCGEYSTYRAVNIDIDVVY